MSLYNMLNDVSPIAGEVLRELKTEPSSCGRFRDAWVALEPTIHMVIFTRCGGNNRYEHEAFFETFSQHPLFMSEEDDPFDSTYNYMRFRLDSDSELHREVLEGKAQIEATPPEERQGRSVEDLLFTVFRNGQPFKKMHDTAVARIIGRRP